MSAISLLMSKTDTMMGLFNLIGAYMLQNATFDVPSEKIEDRDGFGNG
jgi:hypothetical protein